MYDPNRALLELGLVDYVWGNPSTLSTWNSNLQADKSRKEQQEYNNMWKMLELARLRSDEKKAKDKELNDAAVQMAKLNKDLLNASPQEAVIIRKEQAALAKRYPALQDSTAEAIKARAAEDKYQQYKNDFISNKIPLTFAKNDDIKGAIDLVMGSMLYDADKEKLISELRGKKSTEQLVAEARQNAVGSYAGKKTGEGLTDKDLGAKASAAIAAGTAPSSLSDDVRGKIREMGYTWNGTWVAK